jgi:SAM-dependent methyltransferase
VSATMGGNRSSSHPMSERPNPNQTSSSVEKNSSFFRDNIGSYSNNVAHLDTYAAIRASVNDAIRGTGLLLDIGNGGVFDYDTDLAGEIVALDLFLDELPKSYIPPQNVRLKTGSALDIPEPSESFDGALMVMLIHHLVGKDVASSLNNVRRAISEAYRVLKPGGSLIILESCVASWFYKFETIVFPIAAPVIEFILPHPATLQYTPSMLSRILREETGAEVEWTKVPVGKWVLQFGYKVPSALTPARPHRFVVRKPGLTAQVDG